MARAYVLFEMFSRDRIDEWSKFYESASVRVRSSHMPEAWRYPFFSVNLRDLSVDDAKSLEWLIVNGLGGYSSSGVLGLNARRFHGLLAASSRALERRLLLSNVAEEVSYSGKSQSLWMRGRRDGIDAPGKQFLREFKHNLDSVVWLFDLDCVAVSKRLGMIPRRNAIILEYELENRGDIEVRFAVTPIATARDISQLSGGEIGFKVKIYGGHAAGITSEGSYLLLYSEQLSCRESGERWLRDVSYPLESADAENLFTPVVFSTTLQSREHKTVKLLAIGSGSEKEAIGVFKELTMPKGRVSEQKILSSGIGDDIFALSAACDSYLVDVAGDKAALAGYHALSERGRDAMIALPGLTLVNKRFDIAERLFDRMFKYMKDGRIPSGFKDGVPSYEDFDSVLWMIDSLNEYRKYIGDDRFRRFLRPVWPQLKEALASLQKLEQGGLLQCEGGTWTGPLKREGAVEVQGLWYNALKIMLRFSGLMQDHLDAYPIVKKFQIAFMRTYWNGTFLKDTPGDKSLRASQLIVAGLDHHVLSLEELKSLLNAVYGELLTPMGVRTLSPQGKNYAGTCTASSLKPDESYFNGGVWPYLMGPYFRASAKIDRQGTRREALAFVEQFLKRHLREACIGAVSEVFDASEPHTPKGCVSRAINAAEIMRVYSDAVNNTG
jgi:predicted glycogen debranching enzyme